MKVMARSVSNCIIIVAYVRRGFFNPGEICLNWIPEIGLKLRVG